MAMRMVGRLISSSSSQWLKRDRFVRHFVMQPSPVAGGNFVSVDENLNRKRDDYKDVKDFNHHHRCISNNDLCDFLGENMLGRNLCDFLGEDYLGRKFLIRNYKEGDDDKQQQLVPVESLRGKILALYFNPIITKPPFVMPEYLIDLYNTLKLTKPDAFEMIYVVTPCVKNADLPLHDDAISTCPCLAIPAIGDLTSIIHMQTATAHLILYQTWSSLTLEITRLRFWLMSLEFITFPTRSHVVIFLELIMLNLTAHIFFPFTDERRQQLDARVKQLGRETSVQAILGSDSRDFLIARHSGNKVPISSLQNKDVLIYAYRHKFASHELPFVKQLEEIYNNEFPNRDFEIVSLNLEHNGGNEEHEKGWKDHLARVPWLHLPLGDEKIWLLRQMIAKSNPYTHELLLYPWNPTLVPSYPIFLVKPRGESRLDQYGYQVFQNFGIQALPFSRDAAAHSVVRRLKELSFESYVDKASRLGLDFNHLIRNKANGETERVSLSSVLEERGARGILLLFASLGTCSQKRVKSLIDVYLSQDESSSSSSFEVIFVSTDKDAASFDHHFSFMPWFAFQKPLSMSECKYLAKITATIDFHGYSHFIAFGPGQHLLLQQAGLITKSFENCEFPFVNDAESIEHVRFWLTTKFKLEQEVDGTHSYHQWYEMWTGIEDECYDYKEGHSLSWLPWFYFSDDDYEAPEYEEEESD